MKIRKKKSNILHQGMRVDGESRRFFSSTSRTRGSAVQKESRTPSCKGVSPLLAAVLLIAVTVAIATLVMGWMSTITRTTQVTVSNRTADAVDCASASISIDDVYMDAGINMTQRVVVRNSGQTDGLQIVSAQIYNSTGGNFSANSLPIQNFNRGNVTTLVFIDRLANITVIDSCPGAFSRVLVSTNCGGVSAEFTGTPKCFG